MRLLFTAHFNRAYNDAPKTIQQAFDKQAWRFYFRIVGNAYVMAHIVRHPK